MGPGYFFFFFNLASNIKKKYNNMYRKQLFVKTKFREKIYLKKYFEKHNLKKIITDKKQIGGIHFSKKPYLFSMQQASLSFCNCNR